MKARPTSLLDVLERRADEDPDALQFRYLHKGDLDRAAELLTRGELLARARALGTALAEQGSPGDRVLLLYPPGLDLFVAFFACLHAGLIAVPMVPPHPQQLGQTLPRLLGIVAQSGAALVLSTRAVASAAQPFLSAIPALAQLRWIESDPGGSTLGLPRRAPRGPDAIAFLQYTSGSVGAPKGVVVTDAALLANLEMIRVGMVMGPSTPGVFWLPHHHDMGFIGGGLEFVYCGAPCTMMSPLSFIQKPIRWLRAISTFGGVVGGGPCFAYDRCTRRIPDEDLEGLDLRSWRVAFTGAEPVRANVLERFARRFESCGFRRDQFYPCYGLAESTLFVTGKPMGEKREPPRQITVSAEAIERNVVEPRAPAAADDPGARTFVSCGAPRLDAEVVIVSTGTRTRARPGEVGEIWTRGPNIASGYWNEPERSAESFGLTLADTGDGPFLATGDLGFVEDGELYVTGRSKEVLILGGKNHYPQDLEETIDACHPDLRHGGSAAFSFDLADDEVLAVVAEVTAERVDAERKAPRTPPYHDIAVAVRAALQKHHQVVTREIVLIAPRSLVKTTSGKKARLDMRRRFLTGELERV